MKENIEDETELHCYPNGGRYRLQVGPLNAVFTSVRRDSRGNFTLEDAGGELVSFVERVPLRNDVMEALDEISEGDHMELDEYVPAKTNSAIDETGDKQ